MLTFVTKLVLILKNYNPNVVYENVNTMRG